MRTLIVLGFVVVGLSVSVGVLSYTLVPGLIESRLATNLQERYGLEKEPEVEIFSSFPPKLLVGRIDRIEVLMKELRRQGIRLRDVRITVKDADVSVISLLRGDIEREIRTASLVAEAPEKSINEYLGENDLGLETPYAANYPRGSLLAVGISFARAGGRFATSHLWSG